MIYNPSRVSFCDFPQNIYPINIILCICMWMIHEQVLTIVLYMLLVITMYLHPQRLYTYIILQSSTIIYDRGPLYLHTTGITHDFTYHNNISHQLSVYVSRDYIIYLPSIQIESPPSRDPKNRISKKHFGIGTHYGG